MHEIHTVLRNMRSFTRHAIAGEAVNVSANEFRDDKFIAHLPYRLISPYELSLLLLELQAARIEKFFHRQGARQALTIPSTETPTIAAYRNTRHAKLLAARRARSETFTVPLVTIYVSKKLFRFNKQSGVHKSSVDMGLT